MTDGAPQYARRVRQSRPDVLSALFDPVLRRAPTSLPSHFPPRDATDPGPTAESLGFLLYVASVVAYSAYLMWSVLPATSLEHVLGVRWYPKQEWALLVPSWITISVAYVYLAYFALNLSNSVPLDDLLDKLDDPKAFVRPPPAPRSLVQLAIGPSSSSSDDSLSRLYFDSVALPPEAIPPLYDLPLDVVNRVLYDDDDEDLN